VQSVATRWNLSYYMVQQVLEQQQPLSAALLQLQRGDLIPPDAEISTINKFVEMMKPFFDMTEGIGGEK